MFEIKKFEHFGRLSDFFEMIYQYFLDKGWENFKEPAYLPYYSGDPADQLVEFCITKKEMVLTIRSSIEDMVNNYSYVNGAHVYDEMVCKIERKKWNNEKKAYDLFTVETYYIDFCYFYSSAPAFQGDYQFQIYLHYKDDDSILFLNFFPYTYTSAGYGAVVFQPLVKSGLSQYINNCIYCMELRYSESRVYGPIIIRLDSDNKNLTTRVPIKQAYNILDNQLLLLKNLEIYDKDIKTFWGSPLGIIAVQGATWTRFYNINDKKYFCFAPNLLVCCEDEDDLTPVLPEGAEVIDMAPKPTE